MFRWLRRNRPLLFETTLPCTDTTIGIHLDEYLADRLALDADASFRQHIRQCVACATAVHNYYEVHPEERRINRPSTFPV